MPKSVSSHEMRRLEQADIEREKISLSDLMERAGRAVADEAEKMLAGKKNVVILCGPGNNGGDGQVAGRCLMLRGYKVSYLAQDLPTADLVIDALFGIGLSRALASPFKEIVEQLNSSKKPILSVDIPSGLNADTGEVLGVAVKASRTITFEFPKNGFYFKDGPQYTGEIKIAKIFKR